MIPDLQTETNWSMSISIKTKPVFLWTCSTPSASSSVLSHWAFASSHSSSRSTVKLSDWPLAFKIDRQLTCSFVHGRQLSVLMKADRLFGKFNVSAVKKQTQLTENSPECQISICTWKTQPSNSVNYSYIRKIIISNFKNFKSCYF